jgi:ActR/RegA family two-component response regulator
MLYAKSSKIDNFEIYISFLNDIILNDTQAYKDIFKSIIKIVHEISKGSINYSSVPSEVFDLVSILSLNHKDFFAKINPEDLKKAEFEAIKQFLEKDLFEIA